MANGWAETLKLLLKKGGTGDYVKKYPYLCVIISHVGELREQYSAILPAWHWNKKHWSDVYYEQLEEELVEGLIKESYDLVVSKLPKTLRSKYQR